MSDVESHEQYIRESAWGLIVPGFRTLAEIRQALGEMVEYDNDSPLTRERAEQLVTELWEVRQHQLRGPATHPTDDERVDRAFEILRAEGIIATMNIGYTRQDAIDESEQLANNEAGRGYVFFHEQDAARLGWPPAQLYIGFGVVATDNAGWEAGALPVAQRLAAVLAEQGLTVEWDGTVDTRIRVDDVVWLRSLPV